MENENTKEFIKVATQAIHAMEAEDISSQEGADLCRAAAALLRKIKPTMSTWYTRATVEAAAVGLDETAGELESMP